jgi:hypothetical protein
MDAPAAAPKRGPAGAAKPVGRSKRDPLFYAVILLLLADIVCGLGLAVFAEKILKFTPMAGMGLGMAALGLGILAYFLFLGDGRSKRGPGSKDP